MVIRQAIDVDLDAIRQIHLAAFGDDGPEVADLAGALIADQSAQPTLVLVAEFEKMLVGSVIFSTVRVFGLDLSSCFILAPLAVSPDFQKKGIGSDLVRSGLAILQQRKADLVFVLGDPEYYRRFGFHVNHNVRAPFDLPYPEAWMCKTLGLGVPEHLEGVLVCAESLNRPEHW